MSWVRGWGRGVLEDEDFFAGLHQFQALADFQLLAGRTVGEAADARALLFDLARDVRVLLLVFPNLAAFVHKSGNALAPLQRNKCIAGE